MAGFRKRLGQASMVLLAALLLACGEDAPPQQKSVQKPPASAAESAALKMPVECEAVPQPGQEAGEARAGAGDLSPALQTTFERTCKMCHTNPAAGAPLLGDAEAWAPRLAQGRELLIDHTIDGYRGMPPLGLCMACSEDDFARLVEFMSGSSLGGEE